MNKSKPLGKGLGALIRDNRTSREGTATGIPSGQPELPAWVCNSISGPCGCASMDCLAAPHEKLASAMLTAAAMDARRRNKTGKCVRDRMALSGT